MICKVEEMGIFGLSWQEKTAESLFKKLKSIDSNLSKKMKDFAQAGGYNVTLINNLESIYLSLMAKNYQPASFIDGNPDDNTKNLVLLIKNKINIDDIIILKYLESIFELSNSGKIPYSKWAPVEYQRTKTLQKSFDTEQGFFDKAKSISKIAGTNILLLAGIGIISYFYINQKIKEVRQ